MPKTSSGRRVALALVAALACALATPLARAQVFKLQCEVEGKFPEGVPKVAPARVVVELQVIGRHFYYTVAGPSHYAMRVSTLVTEDFQGENLTSQSQLGARRQQRSNQQETEILIERGSMELSAHHDVNLGGKLQRFKYAGRCRQAG